MTLEFANKYLTRDEWINRYDAQKSRNNAQSSLKAFDQFVKARHEGREEELYESLRQDVDWRYRFLDNMVQYWKQNGIKNKYGQLNYPEPNTVGNYFMFIKSWLRSQGIKTDAEEIKQSVKMPRKIMEIRQGLTYEKIKLLLEYSTPWFRALILVLVSSGMRIGETLQVRICDIDMKTGAVHLFAEYTKTKEERYAFVSREALTALQPIVKGRKGTERIFPKSVETCEASMIYLRRRTKLTEMYSNGKNYHVNIHAFRAFFRTKVGAANKDLAEKLVGHRGYLSQYVRYSPEELATEYAKVQHLVTISAEHRLEEKVEKLELQNKSIEDMKRELVEAQDRIRRLENKKN